jgi:hypothetical protein
MREYVHKGIGALVFVLVYASALFLGLKLHVSWTQIYDHLEIITIIGTALFMVTMRFSIPPERRPFTYIPLDAHWWEYPIFYLTAAIFSLSSLIFISCAAIGLPILVPLKFLRVYVLGPKATLGTALVAFPVVFLTTSIAFAVVYMALMVQGKGNLIRNESPLYTGKPGVGWPLAETYYFSLSTMVKGTPQYEGTGWCRWVALAQVTVARLLEVAIVTVGIGAILKRGFGAGNHP